MPRISTDSDIANKIENPISVKGLLEVLPDYGVLRQDSSSDSSLPKDVYISQSQIRRFDLRMGDEIEGIARPPKETERYLSLLKVEKVCGTDPEKARKRPLFEKSTPIFPNFFLKMETTPEVISTRLIDMIAPIGKGQRGMIVAPPKAGKTWLLKDIASGVAANYPDIVLMVALIGERPEEVTDIKRSVKGEVIASNFDESADQQTRAADMCLERAKRLAELGKDVFILLDSITRLARAYNLEEGGSLTIIATALIDTGSRMDDVIFEEFKGTGNMELHLSRDLANRRVYPSIDIKKSGTRHEELLFSKEVLDSVFRLRRMTDLLDDKEVTPLIIDRISKTKTNEEFLKTLHESK